MVKSEVSGFRDKVVVITGAAGDIGAATAKRFAREGARVVITDVPAVKDRSAALAEACEAEGASGVLTMNCDVSRENDVSAVIETAMAQFGSFEVLVYVAGQMIFRPLDEFSTEEWRRLMDVNFMGAVYFTREALRHMKPGGAIVNISSIHAYQTSPLVAPYAAAKAAMLSLTRSTAIEGRSLGIRANAVTPGAIDTRMFRSNPNVTSGAELVPEGMLGRPDDIASVVAFLASTDAAFVNGSVVTADGGRMALL
ncbi:MAG TPA: SDR family oxidoreductase [Rhizomicrobium sp.]|nr:SDR family oxidoreductase [Rhizomicrobium sp.]